jgi:ribosome-associated toxin RatA of RatAB toxin-antitoxin module
MPRISRSALLPYSATRMFALVDDIAAYPQYLPGCLAATELQREADCVTATLVLGKAGLKYAFTTRNLLDAPRSMQFRKFSAHWRFEPLTDTACKTSFELEFEFSASLVDAALGSLFESTGSEMVNAIVRRAEQVYGKA